MQSNIYYITHADICELAHFLTVNECKHHKITVESKTRESGYTKLAESMFTNNVNIIETIMLFHPITTLKEFKTLK